MGDIRGEKMMTEKTTDKLLDVIQTLIERVKDNADNINRLAEKIKELQDKNKDEEEMPF